MEHRKRIRIALALGLLLGLSPPVAAQRQMEKLGRGLVAVRHEGGAVYVGWRLFGTDPEAITFNLYRSTDGGAPVKVNETPIADSTNHVDRGADTGKRLEYFIRPVLEGKELAASTPRRVWDNSYLEIPIQPVPEYRPGDNKPAHPGFFLGHGMKPPPRPRIKLIGR